MMQEAVRHTIYFHMPLGLSVREYLNRFTLVFLEQENLSGLVGGRFRNNPYSLFVCGFPEYVFDPAHTDRLHVHPWDMSRAGKWSPNLIQEAVRHMVKYHTDWKEKQLASMVTPQWLNESGMGGLISKRFGGSPLRLLRFVYPELFAQGVLSEEQFLHLSLGIGVGRFRHPLRAIPDQKRPQVTIHGTAYNFPHHKGHMMHKISQEYGALYAPDKQLIGLFRWNTDPSVKYVSIQKNDVQSIAPEMTKPRRHLAFTEAVRVLSDEVHVIVHALSLEDQAALTDALNTVEPGRVVDYLKLTGASGLRVMADTEFCTSLVLVHELFDPAKFVEVLTQYNGINTKLDPVSTLFTRHVTTVPPGQLEAFRAELKSQLFSANDRIVNALYRAMVYRDSDARATLIADVLQAQRDLAAILDVLDAFGQGDLRLTRNVSHPDGTRELHCTYYGTAPTAAMDVRLVVRPRQNQRGQAAIRFDIIPYWPIEAVLSPEIAFRWDRETATQTALDIHSDSFARLGRLDRDLFPRGYHYTISGGQFAEAGFVEKIVQSFLLRRSSM